MFVSFTGDQVASSTSAASATAPLTEENPSEVAELSIAPGTHAFQVNNYHTKLMQLAQKLLDIATVTVRMEVSGVCSDENLQFANVIDACGNELINNFDKAVS